MSLDCPRFPPNKIFTTDISFFFFVITLISSHHQNLFVYDYQKFCIFERVVFMHQFIVLIILLPLKF